MIRCYLPPSRWKKTVSLPSREAHHLIRVLRVRPGDRVLCLDGEGRRAEATVQVTGPAAATLELGTPQRFPDPPAKITLGVAVPGQGRLEAIVNEATQLGASRIIPLRTERSVVRLSENRAARKQQHLLQIAVEALKQSGTGWLPVIDPFTPWEKLLARSCEFDRVLMATVEGPHESWSAVRTIHHPPSTPHPSPLTTHPSPFTVLLLIGPEGDFTPQEIQQAVERGAHRVSLGPSVLRTETACAAALAVLGFLLRERERWNFLPCAP